MALPKPSAWRHQAASGFLHPAGDGAVSARGGHHHGMCGWEISPLDSPLVGIRVRYMHPVTQGGAEEGSAGTAEGQRLSTRGLVMGRRP